jgi:hypothetical protein
MPPLQELIHQLEVGKGAVLLRRIAFFLTLLTILVVYDYREFKNLASEEGMDMAQVARNLAAGKGYVTQNIRPFSCWLVQQQQPERNMLLKEDHPDLANPPVYPLLLAGVLKLPLVDYRISDTREKQFRTFQPELVIALLNQILLLIAAWLVFGVARRLFDPQVAWLAMFIFVACDLMWRFSVSGQNTILAIIFFLVLVRLLIAMEEAARAGQRGAGWFLGMAAAVGAVLALGTLTRYAFGWLAIPVLVFLGVYVTRQRIALCAVALVVFAALITPWLIRNYNLSGALFGIPGYAIYEETARFQGARLVNSLEPDFSKTGFQDFRIKFVSNATSILREDLPKFGGSWVSAFFLAGLMIPFKRPLLGRLRVFLVLSLLVFIAVQALGRTHLTAASPDVNHDNLLVLLTPLVFIYGVAFYFVLLEQIRLPFPELRLVVNGVFVVLMCAPFIFTLLPPRTFPIAYPPYYPPTISMTASWMNEDELMMSDIPWAVAWYGNRKCVGITANLEKDFFAINDFQKPIQALYLTPVTLDGRFMSQLLASDMRSWGVMLLESLLRREVPAGFPLKMSPEGFFPKVLSDQLFLTDRERWRNWPPR